MPGPEPDGLATKKEKKEMERNHGGNRGEKLRISLIISVAQRYFKSFLFRKESFSFW